MTKRVFLVGLALLWLCSLAACQPLPVEPPCEGDQCPVCTPGDTQKCYSGEPDTLRSRCRQGDQRCEGNGKWGPCEGEIVPTKEVCGDSFDTDCDGQNDNGCDCRPGERRDCGFRTGECKQGSQICTTDGQWGNCTGGIEPKEEICDGNKDEDCDGIIDEDCVCIKGASRDCGSAEGTCKPGKQACDSKGVWGTCEGEVKPTTEICDKLDNDCNGKIDDGITCP